MPEKDNLRAMLTPPSTRQMRVASAVASVASIVMGIILLAGRDWISGGVLIAAVILGWASRILGLRRLYRERVGPSHRGKARTLGST